MDHKETLEKFEELKGLCLKFNQGKYAEVDSDRLACLYGELEPIIEQVLGIEEIEVELSYGGTTAKCKNYIEAGFLTDLTTHANVGYKQLLKVIGRVQQHPEIITQASIGDDVKYDITETQNMIKLFISHSSKDQKLVEELIELLKNALRLPSSEIRCTTIDGHRLPGGANTNEQLKSEVSGTKAFIGVISFAAIDSIYVLFELGARWGANKHLLPLLAPGVSSDILKSPLSGLNALSCDTASQLHQLVNDIAKILEIKPEEPQTYQRYIDGILAISPSEDKNSSVDNKLDSEIPIRELLVMNILAAKNEQSEAAILDYLKEKGMSNSDCHAAISSLTGKGFIRQTNTSPVSYKISPRGYQWAMQNKNLFDQLNAEALSDEANKMLLKAAQRDGVIIKAHNMRERCIQINGENIISSQDPRTVAKWESAFNELAENEFIEERGTKGESFQVTHTGYEYADILKKEVNILNVLQGKSSAETSASIQQDDYNPLDINNL